MESLDLTKIRIDEGIDQNLGERVENPSEIKINESHMDQGQYTKLEEFKFPQRRPMTKEEILTMSRKEIRVVTNYCRLNFNHLKELGLMIYSITIRSTLGEVLEPAMVKTLIVKLNKSESFKNLIIENFKFALQSGNHIYAVPLKMDLDFLKFYLCYNPPENSYIISPLEFESVQEENKKFYFKVIIERIMKIGEEEGKITPAHKEALKRFMNIFIGKKMKMLDYLKSVESRKTIYYVDFKKYENLKINIDSDKFFCPGYQITSNYYENEIMMMKVIPKFRLVRHSTYWDYFMYLKENVHKFEKDCIGGKGLKSYDQMKMRIDGIEFIDPRKMYFEKVQVGQEPIKMNLLEYYLERWNIKVHAGEQLLLFQYDRKKNYQTGEVSEKKLYFFPHLVYIVGLLPDETINARTLKFSPTDKYQNFLDVVGNIKKVRGRPENFNSPSEEKIYGNGNNMNYEPFSTSALVLQLPTLEFKSSKIIPNEMNGEFNNVLEPYNNSGLSKWLVILYDCYEDEGGMIFDKLQEAAVGLNIKIGMPDVINPKRDIINQQEFKDNLDATLKNCLDQESKKKDEDKFQMVAFFTSKRRKNYYSIFKDCFNHSKLDIPSQVVIKENALKRGFSYHTNLLIQMWAKRDLTVWRIKMDPVLKDTVVISYAVTYNKLLGKNLTTVGITTDRYYNKMYFRSEYGEREGGTVFSTNIQKLIKSCLRESLFYLDGKVYKNIIIYREGLNESGIRTVLNFELEALYKGVEEVYSKAKASMPEICLIFVNRICDTKLFQSFSDVMDQSRGHENFSKQNRRNYQNDVDNVPVGTLVDHSITSQNIWEFYLNSTYANQGTNNPTHYIVGYNSTALQNSVIYDLTYKLTYYYYNTSKPVRFPGPLHRVIRRNKFIIENINGDIKSLAPYIDISL